MLALLLFSTYATLSHGGFYIVNQRGHKTNDGLLIADRVGSYKVGTVCDDQFDEVVADVICRDMGYDMYASYDSYVGNWPIMDDYNIVLDDITCDEGGSLSSCLYVVDHDCSAAEAVFLECSCDSSSYISPGYEDGCIECPVDTVRVTPDHTGCLCVAGKYWSEETCVECPSDTYKPAGNDTSCLPCPQFSSSEAGSSECACEAGFHRTADSCTRCPEGSASSPGSLLCVSCSDGTTPLPGGAGCSCDAGLYWNTAQCTTCPGNSYSTRGSTECTVCPEGTVAGQGSSHCEPCPTLTIWSSEYSCISCFSTSPPEGCPSCPPGTSLDPSTDLAVCIPDENSEEEEEGAEDLEDEGETNAQRDEQAAKSGGFFSQGLAILLVVVVIVLLLVVVFLVVRQIRTRRRRDYPRTKPPSIPLVPYQVVHDTDSNSPPIYQPPSAFPPSFPADSDSGEYDYAEPRIYEEPKPYNRGAGEYSSARGNIPASSSGGIPPSKVQGNQEYVIPDNQDEEYVQSDSYRGAGGLGDEGCGLGVADGEDYVTADGAYSEFCAGDQDQPEGGFTPGNLYDNI